MRHGGLFNSVFAPPAGLEPQTESLTPLPVSMIEDTIYLLARQEQESSKRGILSYGVARQHVENDLCKFHPQPHSDWADESKTPAFARGLFSDSLVADVR